MEKITPVEFRGLKTFAHLARVGSFAHASQDLGISPSGLSRQIQRLEEGLGAQLFLRHSRGVILTDTGLRLLERVEDIVQLLARPLKQRLPSERVRSEVVLGYPPEIAVVLIPRVVERYTAKRLDTVVDCQEDIGSSLATRILTDEVDLGLMYDPPNLAQLRICRMLEEPLLVVCNPKLNLGSMVPIRQLANLPLLLPSEKHSHRRLIVRAAGRHGLQLRPAFEVESLPLRKAMVRQGLGCAILPSSAVLDEVSRGTLCVTQLGRTPLTSTLAIVCRKNLAPSEDVLRVEQVLRSETQALVSMGVWSRAHLLCRAGDAEEGNTPSPN